MYKRTHHEQKDVHALPDHTHVHFDKATPHDISDERRGEAHRMEHERKDKRDERRGETKRTSRENKDKRDERRGEMDGAKKKVTRTKAAYKEAVKTSRPGEGKRFKALSGSIAAQYEAKGKSAAEAKKIAGAIAASAGRKKYGAKKMAKFARKG